MKQMKRMANGINAAKFMIGTEYAKPGWGLTVNVKMSLLVWSELCTSLKESGIVLKHVY